MYLGADTPAPVTGEKAPAKTGTTWVGAVEPIGNAVTGILGAFFGKTNPGQPSVIVEKADNTPLYIGGGVALIATAALVMALSKKRKRR